MQRRSTAVLVFSASIVACAGSRSSSGSKTTNRTPPVDPSSVAAPPDSPVGLPLGMQNVADAQTFCVGWYFGCAITSDRRVMCWGKNESGELGDGTTTSRRTPAEVAGITEAERISCFETDSRGGGACVRTQRGELYCWGRAATSQRPVKIAEQVLDVRIGADHSCLLRTDRELRCWGGNYQGTLGDGTTTPRPTPIPLPNMPKVRDFSVQGFGGCAIGEDGFLRCWGRTPCAPGPGDTMAPRLVPGAAFGSLRWVSSRNPLYVVQENVQKADELVSYGCTGTERGPELRELARVPDVVRAVDSVDRLCVSKKDGSVWCTEHPAVTWRASRAALPGPNDRKDGLVPASFLGGAKDFSMTRFHTCGVFSGGLECFGEDRFGELGPESRPSANGQRGLVKGEWLALNEPMPKLAVAMPMRATPSIPKETHDFVCPPPKPEPPPQQQPVRAGLANSAPKPKLLDRISPKQRWTCVNGTTTGLLALDMIGVSTLGWNGFAVAAPQRPQRGKSYYFTRGADGVRAVYFDVSTGDNPIDLRVERGDGQPYIHHATFLGSSHKNPWSLSKPAHLVRVKVNDGFGSSGGLHFIASDVEVLDGKPGYPKDPTALLESVLDPLADENAEQGKWWRASLQAAVDKRMKSDPSYAAFAKDQPQRSFLAGYHATFDEAANELVVAFYGSLTETRMHSTKNPDPRAGTFGCQAPPGADCAPYETPFWINTSIGHSAEWAVRVAFGKNDTILRREELPIESQ